MRLGLLAFIILLSLAAARWTWAAENSGPETPLSQEFRAAFEANEERYQGYARYAVSTASLTPRDVAHLFIEARRGTAEAQFYVGLLYLSGMPSAQQPAKCLAADFLHKAALNGHAPAQAAMAEYFMARATYDAERAYGWAYLARRGSFQSLAADQGLDLPPVSPRGPAQIGAAVIHQLIEHVPPQRATELSSLLDSSAPPEFLRGELPCSS